jgi:hypothetical protein
MKCMKSLRRTVLFSSIFAAAALSSLASGCAGVKSGGGGGGGHDGAGGAFVAPPIDGLVSLEVTPGSVPVQLTQSGGALTGMATYQAIGHMKDGTTMDVTSRVGWPSTFRSLRVQAGVATVTAPGTYTITAASGSVTATAQLVASFNGNFFQTGFDPSGATALDGAPGGTVSVAYPLSGAVFPPNLSPIQVHITKTTASQTAARINFASDNVVNVNYYSACVPGAGSGCYVDLPLEVTQLFIAVSENHNLQLTARVGGLGATLAESGPIDVAWANVPLSGGLYYWTTMADGVVPGYRSPRNTDGTPATGTGIQRYDFGMDGAKPQLVYTDEGAPPSFLGSPPATADGAQCIGCHAITNDGKTMALTVGGSGSSDFALLDLTTLSLTVLDAAAAGGSTSLTDINYYKQFRKSGIVTETTFGPNGDVMVNMYKSKLYLRGTTASLVSQGPVVPSWPEYASDPFWSQTGKFLVFTSFATPDVGTYNTTGLNGDMKSGGQIVIASAGSSMVNDDAHVIVPRQAGTTNYYPVISNDDQLIAFTRSTCSTDPDVYATTTNLYGVQTCDGYDDSSGTIWMTTPAGSVPTRMDHANGTGAYDNSWPRWSPDNGMFRGQRLYWIAFSSRRPYGLQVNTGAPTSTKPQLWFSAVVTGSELFGDPSFPPVWLPNQNPTPAGGVPNTTPTGNHVPQWVKVAVVIPG